MMGDALDLQTQGSDGRVLAQMHIATDAIPVELFVLMVVRGRHAGAIKGPEMAVLVADVPQRASLAGEQSKILRRRTEGSQYVALLGCVHAGGQRPVGAQGERHGPGRVPLIVAVEGLHTDLGVTAQIPEMRALAIATPATRSPDQRRRAPTLPLSLKVAPLTIALPVTGRRLPTRAPR